MELKFTVITVTYNCASTIERAIKSVLSQKYHNIEYIIIDGKSTDGTKEIIQTYENQLAYWVSESDTGIYNAMNKGISHATGDIISFLNGDDWYLNDSVFNKIYDLFDGSNAQIVAGRVTSEGNPRRIIMKEDLDILYYKMVLPHQAIFTRKKIFEKYGYFNEEYKTAGDYEWLLRLYTKGIPITCTDIIVAEFSLGGRGFGCEAIIEQRKVSLKYLNALNKMNLYEKVQEEYLLEIAVFITDRLISKKDEIITQVLKENGISNDCFIWGTGYYGDKCRKLFESVHFNIKAFLDNDKNKIGNLNNGIPIKNISECEINTIIVISTCDYYKEISKQLENLGFIKNKDFISYYSLMMQIASKGIKKFNLEKKFEISEADFIK